MTQTDDLEMIAGRIWRALDLVLAFLAEGIAMEYDRCEREGIDPLSDTPTFAANVRRFAFNSMRPHLPMRARAPMSPLHLDLGPYQLKILHADQGAVPRPATDARKAFYRRNELGVMSMNLLPADALIEIDEKIDSVEEGSLVLVWSTDGPDLVQADFYRPPLDGFPGLPLDLLATTEVVTEDDFSDVRRDDEGESGAATGTDGGRGSSQDRGERDDKDGDQTDDQDRRL